MHRPQRPRGLTLRRLLPAVVVVSVGGPLLLSAWYHRYPDFSRLPPQEAFRRVMGRRPTPEETEIRSGGYISPDAIWVWLTFHATPNAVAYIERSSLRHTRSWPDYPSKGLSKEE